MERFLAPHGIGHAFAAPFAENIAAFLEKLSWEDYAQERERVLALGRPCFSRTAATCNELLAGYQSLAELAMLGWTGAAPTRRGRILDGSQRNA